MTLMSEADAPAGASLWTCPFCPLLCDGLRVSQKTETSASLTLVGSECAVAQRALSSFGAASSSASAQIDGAACSLDDAIAAAARVLASSHLPLFGGLGTDVAGARALYRLSCETGAISDAAQGPALMHGLRALQDRGAFTTTIAEVRTRADVIVCLGGSPTESYPEFFRRVGVDDGLVPERHVVLVGEGGDVAGTRAVLAALTGVSTEFVPLHGDLFSTASTLAALVAGRTVRQAPAPLVALAARLKAAKYAIFVWQNPTLPAHGALFIETVNALVATLNRTTRAAGFPLGGGNGGATAMQVHSWLSGVPLRSRVGPSGIEHEPWCFDAERLLDTHAVDSLLWVSSFNADPLPTVDLPRVVIGHPDLAARVGTAASGATTVFIPVATPGIGAPGHLFRVDGVVVMPLHRLRADALPGVDEVISRIAAALRALRSEVTT